jgi:sortase A
MNRNNKTIILILTIVALVAFGAVFVRAFYYYPSDEVPLPNEIVEGLIQENGVEGSPTIEEIEEIVKPPSKEETAAIASMRLVIPKIKVDARVQEVGLTSKGNMAAPRNFSDVGWYKYGAFPGETGSAVLAGHVNNGVALPAVFSRLDDLGIGDDIYIRTKDGKELHYRVSGHTVYDFDSSPPEVFNENDGKYLKLITCTGTFMKDLRTHDKRLVVKAVLVE